MKIEAPERSKRMRGKQQLERNDLLPPAPGTSYCRLVTMVTGE